jgi:hypothetical protein
VGVNWFAPPGSRRGAFSVGDGGGGADVVVAVVVVVVVVVSGACSSSLAQDAVRPTIATMASPPATAESCRARRCDSISDSILMARYQLILDPKPTWQTEYFEASIIAQLIFPVSKFTKIDADAPLLRRPFAGGRGRWCLVLRQLIQHCAYETYCARGCLAYL